MDESSSTDTGASPTKFLAIYGALPDVEARTMRTATSTLGLEATFFDNPASLAAALKRRLPVAILVGVECDGAVEVLTQLRGNVRYSATPLIGITDERTDLAFGSFYDRGGDDLISGRSLRAAVSRLRPLIERAPAPARPRSGFAVVATSDLRWRNVVARTLSNVGIESRIVGNCPDAADAACEPALFVVASDDLLPGGATTALAQARARGSTIPWLISAPARRAGALRASLPAHGGVTVVDVFAPPDNLLFTANELRRPQLIDQRASARVLFGTAVAFRIAGAAEDDLGFTYNLSTGGVFVRTLAPIDAGQEVWLELWPPRTERAVRIVGRVAWRRTFGPNESATVPPGFGIHITGGLPDDLERWEVGARALIADPMAPQLRPDVSQHMSSAPPGWLAKAVV
ncbi:MAG: PilZ domain-containing protein [Myxococcota bacterium]|nr:PilZ domain-containing protein [Myxococcota bacterium]